jgi:large subunit ribosomal protein L13
MSTNPMFVMQFAVKGMLPKNKLREKRMKRLHVYKDANHPFNLDLNKKD